MTQKSKKPTRPGVRSLKIHSKYRDSGRDNQKKQVFVPEIKLCEKWLERIGFKQEGGVQIYTPEELIVIRPSG